MTDAAQPTPPPTDKDVYGVLVGPIDQVAVMRVANAAAITSGNNVTHCHMAIQTLGGNVADGVALYNIFRTFPVPLTLYNIGSVASAGVIAFLGGERRITSAFGTFMIHRTTSSMPNLTSEKLRAAVRSVELDDERTEKIFEPLKLTADHRATHKIADLWLSSTEAVETGVATKIGDFAPPKGTSVYYLGPTL